MLRNKSTTGVDNDRQRMRSFMAYSFLYPVLRARARSLAVTRPSRHSKWPTTSSPTVHSSPLQRGRLTELQSLMQDLQPHARVVQVLVLGM